MGRLLYFPQPGEDCPPLTVVSEEIPAAEGAAGGGKVGGVAPAPPTLRARAAPAAALTATPASEAARSPAASTPSGAEVPHALAKSEQLREASPKLA